MEDTDGKKNESEGDLSDLAGQHATQQRKHEKEVRVVRPLPPSPDRRFDFVTGIRID